MDKIIKTSFNLHYINHKRYRDYQIDNVLIRGVSDEYVLKYLGLDTSSELSEEQQQKFLNSFRINVVLKTQGEQE